jgi:uncharacterized protein with WD repeat
MPKFIEIFRHQQPYVAEMVIETLRKNSIPCYLQQGSITGIMLSPVMPTAAPGVEYVVFVPEDKIEDARVIVDSIPIDKELLNVKWRKVKDPKRKWKLLLFWFFLLGLPVAMWFVIQLCQIALRK